ncbi:hypothetical protein UFOVP199_37 [uncultured Caudovirales phage]|uniref:6-hydroxymethylpterin diphosphokinase MptE-like n=1 Tax=uncultured Caudovirales phage TaxID=2100421 RepID=A0A6J7WNB8_9CAUD|nr:hypothetical protein UFOVP199_37 [uncultured Caudovirales phage]
MGLTLLPESPVGFKDSRKGETIWVLGSGASLNHISRDFFFDKTCVCVNNVGITLNLPEFYTVTHYHRDAIRVATQRPDLPVIAPVADLGAGGPEESDREPWQRNVYRFATNPQMFGAFDAQTHWPTDPDALVAGPTSLHMTMHFAAYLGAAHIVLVGADCGLLGDESNFAGYTPGDNPMEVWQRTLPGVANKIRAAGVSVHSLNPFVNFALEGVPFRSPRVSIN